MCFGQSAPEPIRPATPPPPPPVLEQVAPTVSAPTQAEAQNNKALGTKQYRSTLSIGSAATSASNTGVGVAS